MTYANSEQQMRNDYIRCDHEMQQMVSHLCSARDSIFELARNNATIAACVQHWRKDQISWEEMLTVAVQELARQNESLLESATKHFGGSFSIPVEDLCKDHFSSSITTDKS